MVVAQALQRHWLGRGWRWPAGSGGSVGGVPGTEGGGGGASAAAAAEEEEEPPRDLCWLLHLFWDAPSERNPLSIHNLCTYGRPCGWVSSWQREVVAWAIYLSAAKPRPSHCVLHGDVRWTRTSWGRRSACRPLAATPVWSGATARPSASHLAPAPPGLRPDTLCVLRSSQRAPRQVAGTLGNVPRTGGGGGARAAGAGGACGGHRRARGRRTDAEHSQVSCCASLLGADGCVPALILLHVGGAGKRLMVWVLNCQQAC